jgi:hypothetical protein
VYVVGGLPRLPLIEWVNQNVEGGGEEARNRNEKYHVIQAHLAECHTEYEQIYSSAIYPTFRNAVHI